MTWKIDSAEYPGYPNIEPFFPSTFALAGLAAAYLYPPIPAGYIVCAEDPVWGVGEFIWAKAGGTIRLRGLCVLTPVWNATNRNFDWNATECPNTALLGRMLGVVMSEQGGVGAVNALTVGQYGWFMISGISPINGTASVAADTAIGITAAGQIGANTAGKELLNARGITAATQTVVVASVDGVSGSSVFRVANADGFFVGGYLSGTGVGAAAICQAIDRTSVSGAVTITASVVNSAAVTGNVTITYNNATIFYNVVHMNRVFAQGAIT